jgi:phosphopantothenoylcysteine decarboxylase/phosphopantothenate--cysteine ligase
MHTEMWEHPATAANVATLRARGAIVLDPASGRLTGADTGPGRLPEPAAIAAAALRAAARAAAGVTPDLAGRHVLISAGGTREELDPVRFLGNWSTGRQGYALAAVAAARGAQVTIVAANVELPDPAGARVIRVVSARDLRDAMTGAAGAADAIVMAAAVADFRPADRSAQKIKKRGEPPAPITLTENPDVLRELVAARRTAAAQVIVGFAAETGDHTGSVLQLGRAKLARKGCDLLVVNDVSGGAVFGSDDNEAVILGADGTSRDVPRGSKTALAHAIWDEVVSRLQD